MTAAPKPLILRPDLASIPDAMKGERRWVCWRLVYREGERKPWTKSPINPESGYPAKSTVASTWGSFLRAVRRHRAGGADGIGFVLGAGWVGIDVDACVDDAGNLSATAVAIRDRLRTFGELSVSGRGVHFICRGALPPGRRRKGPIEMYDSGRYFTMTGRRLEGCPSEPKERRKTLAALHAEIFADEYAAAVRRRARQPVRCNRSDAEIIRLLLDSRSGDRFRRLWSGDTSDYAGDDSRADFALCGILAWQVGPEPERIDRLFRCSGLMRAKWDRPDYRDRTIAGVLHGR
jgi:putative DNA primase/helicase